MSSTNILALQALPETQPLNYPGIFAGALVACTHTCGDSCQVTCVKITCRHGWTCAATSLRALEREKPDRPNLDIGTDPL